MRPYRLPLKFIGLWVLNLAILLGIGFGLGVNDFLIHTLRLKDLTYLYLFAGAIMAALEEWLIDKLNGNS